MRKAVIYLFFIFHLSSAISQDWSQYQHDAARTGRTQSEIPPPYRVRWIWAGENLTLRNQMSEPGWPDNLTSVDGYSFPMPDSVNITLSQLMQPVVAQGKVFFGTQEGEVFCISSFDGSTLWKSMVPGGIITSGAVIGNRVVFAGVAGNVMAFDAGTGDTAWSVSLKAAVTGSPCICQNRVFIADHKGRVTALDATSGSLLWQKQLSAPVTGHIAASNSSVFVPCEDMNVYALDQETGAILTANRVKGQGFRMTHPVVSGRYVYITSALTPLMGSEYMMEDVMTASGSLAEEDANIRLWLQGINMPGKWNDASVDWQHLFALDTATLVSPFLIPCGPSEGCGYSPISPVVDHLNRTLCWWKTRYPKLTGSGAFGTAYSLDICGINPDNGNRIPVDNGVFANIIQETDNLYALSSAGKYLWLRQDFRGTQVIDLTNSAARHVVAPIRSVDGGYFNADICYRDQNPPYHFKIGPYITRNQCVTGRTAPAPAGNLVFIAETFGIVAIEHDNSK